MTISDDRRSFTVQLDATLDAAGIGDLIELLAEIRGQMQPPVPRQFPAGEAVAVVQKEPQLKIGQTADNTVLLALRHPGIGWLTFELSPLHAAALRDSLARHTVGGVNPLQELLDLRLEPGEGH